MIAWASLLPSVLGSVGEAIKKAVPDKDLAKKLEAEIQKELLNQDNKEFQRKADIIIAEAKGEGALQRNWRPITMLVFVGLIAAHWMGWTAPGLTDTSLTLIFTTVQIGLGGYIGARTVDKGIDKLSAAWKESKNG